MAYNITKTDGTNLVTIADGTTDTSYSSLTLIGKNFAGYGEFVNENLVHLLENFSNSAAPNNPIQGQLWWKKASDGSPASMQVYDGTQWKAIGAAEVKSTEPVGTKSPGDAWWDSTNNQYKVWTGSTWTVVGPVYTTSTGVSGAIPTTTTNPNITGGSSSVVKIMAGNEVVAVVSKDPTFTTTSIPGFTTISPGITLNPSISGITFNGTATNASKLGGYPAADYLRAGSSAPITAPVVITNDAGLTFGADGEGKLGVTGSDVILRNTAVNGDINLNVKYNGADFTALIVDGATGKVLVPGNSSITSADGPTTVATKGYVDSLTGNALLRTGANSIIGDLKPDASGVRDLGATGARFKTVYTGDVNASGVVTASQFVGSLDWSNITNTPVIGGSYTLPTASASTLGGVKVGSGLSIDSSGILSATGSGTTVLQGKPMSTAQVISSSTYSAVWWYANGANYGSGSALYTTPAGSFGAGNQNFTSIATNTAHPLYNTTDGHFIASETCSRSVVEFETVRPSFLVYNAEINGSLFNNDWSAAANRLLLIGLHLRTYEYTSGSWVLTAITPGISEVKSSAIGNGFDAVFGRAAKRSFNWTFPGTYGHFYTSDIGLPATATATTTSTLPAGKKYRIVVDYYLVSDDGWYSGQPSSAVKLDLIQSITSVTLVGV